MRTRSRSVPVFDNEYWAAFTEAVTDRTVGRGYNDRLGLPLGRLTVCVPVSGPPRRVGYRDGWLSR
jgi:hypothetical protein